MPRAQLQQLHKEAFPADKHVPPGVVKPIVLKRSIQQQHSRDIFELKEKRKQLREQQLKILMN